MKLLTITLTYLKQTFASRSVLIFTLLMPIIFTVALGAALSGLGTDDTPPVWRLLAADEDRSPQSAAFLKQLEADPALEVVAAPAGELRARLEAGAAPAALHIPAGFGHALLNGQPVELRLYRSAQNLMDAQVAFAAVEAAAARTEAALDTAEIGLQTVASLGLPAPDAAQALAQADALWNASPPLEVRARAVTRLQGSQIPIGAAQSSPGMLVMYVLFLTFAGGTSLLMERERGTLRRLLVMPLRKSTLIGGKLLGIFLSALLQMGLMVVFGALAMDVHWGQAPAALTVMLLAYGFASTALGLMVAALARTSAQADGLSTVTVMALSALGGAWWPIEIVPPWMQRLAHALPTYWGMQGFQDIIVRGLGLAEILPAAGILLAFGLGFLAVGLWRFRWE